MRNALQPSLAARMLRLGAAVAMLAVVSCQYLHDLVVDEPQSTAPLVVVVVDAGNAGAIPGATVVVQGHGEATDDFGHAVFESVPTGPATAQVTAQNYQPATASIDVPLAPTVDTVRLTWLGPRIIEFRALDSLTTAIDDTVWFAVDVGEPTALIDTVSIIYDDADTVHAPKHGVSQLIDTVAHVFTTAGPHTARLEVRDQSGDTASQVSNTIIVNSNHRPVVTDTLIQNVFLVGQYGQAKITVTDPDNNLDHMLVQWGDTNAPQAWPAVTGVYYSPEPYPADAPYKVFDLAVTVYDKAGAVTTVVTPVPVYDRPPFVFATTFTFVPGDTIARDSDLTVGFSVLQAPSIVTSVTWCLNPGHPDSVVSRDTYNGSNGGAIAPDGNTFWHSFTTVGLPLAANTIRVTVQDTLGIKAARSVQFYIH